MFKNKNVTFKEAVSIRMKCQLMKRFLKINEVAKYLGWRTDSKYRGIEFNPIRLVIIIELCYVIYITNTKLKLPTENKPVFAQKSKFFSDRKLS